MLRLLVIYSVSIMLTISCRKKPAKKYQDFFDSMLKIRDSLHGLDTNTVVRYWIEADSSVGCDITLKDQNINNNLFELQQCEDCFTFYTGKGKIVSLADSSRNYEDHSTRMKLDILNKTPKDLIWGRIIVVYDTPKKCVFYHHFSDGKVWGLYSADCNISLKLTIGK